MKDGYIDYEKFKKDLNVYLINNMQIINDNSASNAKLLEQYLIDNQIKFKKEVVFDNFKGHRFDFYLYDLNTLIEYDGEQHFKSIEYFGGEEYLKERQLKDKEKDEYCHLNHINLLRVKYDMTMKEMTKYLSTSLKLIGIYDNYICHKIDYQLKEITIENLLNLNELSKIVESIDEIKEDKWDMIDEKDKIVLEQYIEIINNGRIILNNCYDEYLNYYKAYYFEKSKLNLVDFKNYLIDCLKNTHKISNKPIKCDGQYSFVLRLLKDDEIDDEFIFNPICNAIKEMCEYLKENTTLFENDIIPVNIIISLYQDKYKNANTIGRKKLLKLIKHCIIDFGFEYDNQKSMRPKKYKIYLDSIELKSNAINCFDENTPSRVLRKINLEE